MVASASAPASLSSSSSASAGSTSAALRMDVRGGWPSVPLCGAAAVFSAILRHLLLLFLLVSCFSSPLSFYNSGNDNDNYNNYVGVAFASAAVSRPRPAHAHVPTTIPTTNTTTYTPSPPSARRDESVLFPEQEKEQLLKQQKRKRGRGRKGRGGSRRCKCAKRLRKELKALLENRLQDWEDRHLHASSPEGDPPERDLLLALDPSNKASRSRSRSRAPSRSSSEYLAEELPLVEERLEEVRDDVRQTRQALTSLEAQVGEVWDGWRSTGAQLEDLTQEWRRLREIVTNLTTLVTAMEGLMPLNHDNDNDDKDNVSAVGGGGCDGGGGGGDVAVNRSRCVQAMAQAFPRSCDEVYRKGGMQFEGDYYILIKPDGVKEPFKALCRPLDNAGWTVIQKREDGSVDFFRGWEDYKAGFGSLHGEFWLGNDNIHLLTAQEATMLRIELKDWNGGEYQATYNSFSIEDEEGLYRLHVDGYHGNAGDSLRSRGNNHDGMPFSAKDRDNDRRHYDNCAEHYHGAWWFNDCFHSHLNGRYYANGSHDHYFQNDGVQWNAIRMYFSLRSALMMVSPAPLHPDLDPDLDLAHQNEVKDFGGHSGGGGGGA